MKYENLFNMVRTAGLILLMYLGLVEVDLLDLGWLLLLTSFQMDVYILGEFYIFKQ